MSGLLDLSSRLFLGFAAYVLMPAMVGIVSLAVVLRYVFNTGLPWTHEVAELFLLMTFMAGVPFVTRADKHIRVEMLYEHYGTQLRALADAVSALLGGAFVGLLAYRAFMVIPGMMRRGEGAEYVDLPHWPIAAFVGVAAAVSVAAMAGDLVRAVLVLLGRGRQP